MKLFASILLQICILGSVFMLYVDADYDDDYDEYNDYDDMDYQSYQASRTASTARLVCGSRPAMTSKRDVETMTGSDEHFPEQLDKILGGSYATQGEFPWQANIYVNRAHVCGGAIISEYWVLTAAECFRGASLPSHVKVVLGDHSLTQDEQQQTLYHPERIFVHELAAWSEANGTVDYNIALIKIQRVNNRGIIFTNYIQPACLPTVADRLSTGTNLLFSGWGHNSQTGSYTPPQLKKVSLPILDQTTCSTEVYPAYITERMFCAGVVNGNADACFGDGGGPAVYKSGGVYILAGVMTAGTGCSSPNYPVVFARVSSYLNWIVSIVRQ